MQRLGKRDRGPAGRRLLAALLAVALIFAVTGPVQAAADTGTITFTVIEPPESVAAPTLDWPEPSNTNNPDVTFTGTAEPGATVTIYLSTDWGGPYLAAEPTTVADGEGNFSAVITLDADGRYYAYAVASMLGVASDPSHKRDVTLDRVPPGPPSDLSLTPGATTVQLGWTESDDWQAQYLVYRDDELVARVDDYYMNMGHIDLGLLPETGYTYAVTAVDYAGNESAAVTGAVTTLDAAGRYIPDPPVLDQPVSPTNQNLITLTGQTDPGAEIFISYSRDGVWTGREGGYFADQDGSFAAEPYLGHQPPEGAYAFTALALVGDESSQPATPATVVIDRTPPGPPSGLTATLPDDATVLLTWTAPPDDDLAGFTVARDGHAIATTTLTTYTDAGRQIGASHTYAVAAFDAAGNTSDAVAVNVLVLRPDDPAAGVFMASVGPDKSPGAGDSQAPALSGDGETVAFHSGAELVHGGALAFGTQIFLRDWQTPATAKLSVNAQGQHGNTSSWNPSVSRDGTRIAFQSLASNLTADPDNGQWDIYLVDRDAGSIQRLSKNPDGAAADRASMNAAISLDGSAVAFQSWATGLVPGLPNPVCNGQNCWDIFVWSPQLQPAGNHLVQVSIAHDGTAPDQDSITPALSADGCRVAFASRATNLLAQPVGGHSDQIWVRDLCDLAVGTVHVSRATDGAAADQASAAPVISGDGRYVAFWSSATNLADAAPASGIYLHDLQTGATELVSILPHGTAANHARPAASISYDGGVVAFAAAPTLSVADPDLQVYVRDRPRAETFLVSAGPEGEPAEAHSGDGLGPTDLRGSDQPSLSADGTLIAFRSRAADLVAAPGEHTQIYVALVPKGAPPLPAILTPAEGQRIFGLSFSAAGSAGDAAPGSTAQLFAAAGDHTQGEGGDFAAVAPAATVDAEGGWQTTVDLAPIFAGDRYFTLQVRIDGVHSPRRLIEVDTRARPIFTEPAAGAHIGCLDLMAAGDAGDGPAGADVLVYAAPGDLRTATEAVLHPVSTQAATVAEDGSWQSAIDLGQAGSDDGPYTLEVRINEPTLGPLISERIVIMLDTEPPAPPQTVAATAVGYAHVDLAWTGVASEPLHSVRVFRVEGTAAELPAEPPPPLATPGPDALSGAHSDRPLQPDTAYTYWVAYVDLAGNLGVSAPLHVTTAAVSPPVITAPADGDFVGAATLEAAGQAEPDATLTLYAGPGSDPADLAPVAEPALAADGAWQHSITLSAGDGPYTLVAAAALPDIDPLLSDPVTVHLDTAPPAPPVLQAAALPRVEVALTWTGDPGEPLAAVAVWRLDGEQTHLPDDRPEPLVTLGPAATDWTDADVERDTTYTYWAAHIDRAGNHAFSAPVVVTTPFGVGLDSAAVAYDRGPLGHAAIGTELTITARGDSGHHAAATVSYVDGGQSATAEVSLAEVEEGVYRAALAITEGMTAITEVSATLTHADDAELVSRPVAALSAPIAVGGSISGQVSRAGQPVAGVQLTAWSAALGAGAQAATDADGRYTIAGLPPGAYMVRATATDFNYMDAVPGVSVAAGAVTADVDFALPMRYTVRVRLYDADDAGQALPGIQVRLSTSGYQRWQPSGADGIAVFTDVPAAQVLLMTSGARLARYQDGNRVATIPPPETPAGVDEVTVDLALVSHASLYGHTVGSVVNEFGQPVPAALVYVNSYATTTAKYGQTGADGGFSLQDFLPSGSYYITVRHPDYLDERVTGLAIATGQTTAVDPIVLSVGRSLSGTVSGVRGPAAQPEQAAPLPGVLLTATHDASGRRFTARSQSDGSFRLEMLPEGAFTVATSNSLGYRDAGASVTISGADVSGQHFELRHLGAVAGQVTAGGLPLPAASVSVWQAGQPATVRRVAGDDDGFFAVDGLEPGEYTVQVRRPDYQGQQQTGVAVALGETTTLDFALQLTPDALARAVGGRFGVDSAFTAPGETLTYAARFAADAANHPAAAVVLYLPLPAHTTPVAGRLTVTVDGVARPAAVAGATEISRDDGLFLRVPVGALAPGAAGQATYQVRVDTGLADELVLRAGAAIEWQVSPPDQGTLSFAADLADLAETEVVFTTIEGPSVTSEATIRVFGKSIQDADIYIYAGDELIGTATAQEGRGRWWSAAVTLPGSAPSEHTLTAQAVLHGELTSPPSQPLAVTWRSTVPRISEVNITAGWNRDVTINPDLGLAALAAPELHEIGVRAWFDPAVGVSNVRFRFIDTVYPMAPAGDHYAGAVPATWTGFGEHPIVIIATGPDGLDYAIPVALVLVLIDPSGYIYEALPTNRLEGVTAVVEQCSGGDLEADCAGGEWVFWPADLYGQVNPQSTDADGRYGWDVPMGLWRVIWSKEGYATLISRSVPVPPPETELNEGMVATTLPQVSGAGPADGAVDVAVNSAVSISFDKHMQLATFTPATFTLTDAAGNPVAGAISGADGADGLFRTVQFLPDADLQPHTTYTARVSAVVQAYSNHSPDGDAVWSFTTGAAPDVTPPQVIGRTPAPGATGVGRTPVIRATFDEALDPAGVSTDSVQLLLGAAPVSGSVSYDAAAFAVTFTPATALAYSATYTVRLSTDITDAAGNPLAAAVEWSFTTVAAPTPPPAADPDPDDPTDADDPADPADPDPDDPDDADDPADPADPDGDARGPVAEPFDLGTLTTVLAEDGSAAVTAAVDPDRVDAAAALQIDLSAAALAAATDAPLRTRTAELPGAVLQQLAAHDQAVVLDAGAVRFAWPAAALADLPAVQAAAAAQEPVSLRIAVQALAPDSAAAAATVAAEQGLALAGPVLELTAAVVGAAGDAAAVSRFAGTFSVGFAYAAAGEPEHLGVYRWDEAAARWSYVGGRLDADQGLLHLELDGFSRYAVLEYTGEFADVGAEHWARADIRWLAARQIIRGVSATDFDPGGAVTRAQFAALLTRALDLPAAAPAAPSFTDVAPAAWYYAEVEAAAAAGLIEGYAGAFRPDERITRQEMAVILARARSRQERGPALSPAEVDALLAAYADAAAMATWARDAIAAAVEAGLLTGRTPTTWAPAAVTTRAEAAVVLRRLLTQ